MAMKKKPDIDGNRRNMRAAPLLCALRCDDGLFDVASDKCRLVMQWR